MTGAPGYAVRTPDSLLRGPVSTALTLPSLPAKHPGDRWNTAVLLRRAGPIRG